MKNSLGLRTLFLLVTALALSGCDEKYGVTTIISRDGSCDRIITLSRSSQDFSYSGFPLPLDSTWETSWKDPEKNERNGVFTARKHFPRFDSLAAAYVRYHEPEKLQIRPRLDIKFRWFYTYFVYEETYERFDPFHALPPTAVMSNDEIHRLVAGEKSDSLMKKLREWDSRNIFEFYYQHLREAAMQLHDPLLPDSLLLVRKEGIYQALVKDSKKSGHTAQEKDTNSTGQDLAALASVLPVSVVEKLRRPIEVLERDLERKYEIYMKISGGYTNTVVMPGVILATNALEVRGNSAIWQFDDDQLRLADYVMQAESRTINIWSFVATGGLFLLLIGGPAVVRYGRHRHWQRLPGKLESPLPRRNK